VNQVKLRRGTFQHVESELYAYHDTRKEIVRLKNEILHASAPPDENIGGGRGNLPGDPTGRTAVLMVTHRRIEQLERIVEAIEISRRTAAGKEKAAGAAAVLGQAEDIDVGWDCVAVGGWSGDRDALAR